MRRVFMIGFLAALAAVHGGAARAICAGDCNGDGRVLINEVVTGVGIGLETAPLGQCQAADSSGDGRVGINEVITAVNNGLTGCPTFAGTYSGSAILDTDRMATIELNVAADGGATGVVVIDDPRVPLLVWGGAAGGGAGTSRVDVVGSIDLETGAFSVTGSYVDPNGPTLEIEVSGVLPFGGQPGSISFRIGSFTYAGSFGSPRTATPTRTPTMPSGNVHMVEVGKPTLPFDPELVEIDPGDTVVWTWVGGTHSVVSSAIGGSFPACNPDGRFDSGAKSSGTFSYTFTAPGTYEYHCGVADHCESFETGVVIVRGPPTATVTRTPTTIPTPTLTPTPETIGGVSTEMLGIFSGTVTNDFGGVFPARFQIAFDATVVHVTDITGYVLGVGGQLTMVVESPTRLTYENPDPFFMRSLELELDAPGHVTGHFQTGSMGMGSFGLEIDLTKE